jgi:uncharacterized protein (TIGR03437 family)
LIVGCYLGLRPRQSDSLELETGATKVTVRREGLTSLPFDAAVLAASPELLLTDEGLAMATSNEGAAITRKRPAARGSIAVVRVIWLGRVSHDASPGLVVTARLDKGSIEVGEVRAAEDGLYEVEVRLRNDVAGGDRLLSFAADGIWSPGVLLPVQ